MTEIDPLLMNILNAAERGEKVPKIVLVVGPWVVMGSPVSTERFRQLTNESLADTTWKTAKIRDRARADSKSQAATLAAGYLAAMGGGDSNNQVSISIESALMVNGISIRIPAMRVPLASVDSWWVTTHTAEAQSSYNGGGVGVGFSF